jgi:lysyl-tRNA synthetase class 2
MPVDSTSVKSVGYEPASRVLEVEFQGGRVYRYFDVPPRRYRAFLDAESAGRFLNTEIKGVYPYAQVNRPTSRR